MLYAVLVRWTQRSVKVRVTLSVCLSPGVCACAWIPSALCLCRAAVRATSVTPTEVQVSRPRRRRHAFPSFHLVPLPSSHLKSTSAGPYPLQISACFSWTRTKELPCLAQIPYFQGHSTPRPLRTRLEFRTLHILERVCRVITSSPRAHELLDHYGWTILKEGKGVVGKQRSQIVSELRGCGIGVEATVPLPVVWQPGRRQ